MQKSTEIIEERVRFGEGGRLAGMLHYPASASPERAVLLCSPHPNFAGDMDNNVIQALAERLAADSVVLRFDYRGVGASHITLPAGTSVLDYWEDVEEKSDFADALADTTDAADLLYDACEHLPMVAVGYSFGSAMATQSALADSRFERMAAIAPPLTRISFAGLAGCIKPCLMLCGTDDFVYDATIAATLARSAGQHYRLDILNGMDHFFRGHETIIAARVAEFI